ncbi:MAG: hypothetical protein ABH811_01210 [archaeon]
MGLVFKKPRCKECGEDIIGSFGGFAITVTCDGCGDVFCRRCGKKIKKEGGKHFCRLCWLEKLIGKEK